MEKYCFIAEKPSLEKEVKAVYKKHKKEIDTLIGGEIVFTALVGHVCGFANPEEYPGWDKKWEELPLPMVPEVWKIVVKEKEVYKRVTDFFKNEKCTAVIVGTDSDVEGNGIYYLLEQKAGWQKKKALRFYIESDLTEKSIKSAFLNMQDYHTYPRDVRMTSCYLIRSKYDWMQGNNLTVKASIRSGNTLRVGRVKGPTLKLVYDNSKAIEEFVPVTTYLVEADYMENFSGQMVGADWKVKQFEKKEDAEAEAKKLTSSTAIVQKVEKKTVKTQAPHLLKLSDLQSEAGTKFGYAPDEVDKALQSLYEKHKLMSYPRTDGRYISTEKAKELKDILQAVSAVSELKPLIDKIPEQSYQSILGNKMYVDNKRVEKASHDALLPTTTRPNLLVLNEKEKNIYLFVCRRVISILYPPLQEEKATIYASIDGSVFKSMGTAVVSQGWTEVVNKKREGDVLPVVTQGQILNVKGIRIKDRTTTPPKRLTSPTLIAAMENISSAFEDKEYKNIMSEASGIGTPASRGTIIKELIESGYIDSRKNVLYITELGKGYIEQLSGCDIIDVKTTADMEMQIKKIKEGDANADDVEKLMDEHLMQMLTQLDSVSKFTYDGAKSSSAKMAESEFLCPVCKKKMSENDYHVICTCGFKLVKKLKGKTLTKAQMKELLSKGRTSYIEGFVSSKNTKFGARLCLEEGKLTFDFDSGLMCPECGKSLTKQSWGYGCSGYRDGCRFSISGKFGTKELTERNIRNLLEGKEVGPFNLQNTSGRSYKASLKLVKEEDKWKLKPEFAK